MAVTLSAWVKQLKDNIKHFLRVGMAVTPSAWVKQFKNDLTHSLRAGDGCDMVSMENLQFKEKIRHLLTMGHN